MVDAIKPAAEVKGDFHYYKTTTPIFMQSVKQDLDEFFKGFLEGKSKPILMNE